jgi:hypothetical protein
VKLFTFLTNANYTGEQRNVFFQKLQKAATRLPDSPLKITLLGYTNALGSSAQ